MRIAQAREVDPASDHAGEHQRCRWQLDQRQVDFGAVGDASEEPRMFGALRLEQQRHMCRGDEDSGAES
jgi:hypothetical protein